MSILSELKKLTGKQNAKVVSEALPDSAGGGVFVVNITVNGHTGTMDKTFSEILDAAKHGIVYVQYSPNPREDVAAGIVTRAYMNDLNDYRVNTTNIDATEWITSDFNGYPAAKLE